MEDYLPEMRVAKGVRKGRNVYEGYQRGWGIEFGPLREKVRNDPLYAAAMAVSQARTILMEDHRMNLFLLIRFFLPNIERGDIIEFGAYRGGNAIFMAHVAKALDLGIAVHALDTFEGMPETDKAVDAHSKGDFSKVDFDELAGYVKSIGLDNLRLHRGLFADTFEGVRREAGTFSLAHIDCDTYPSVKFSYDTVKPHMVDGGYIVFDDATVSSCIGATEAVEEEVIRRDGLHSEQIFPQWVFRSFRDGRGRE
ncbi:MAG: class I SAM-dependent methyltransferase [Gammaproteobacteria bacterium]|nr:class I SAM-dependent methyltransferase [Gammaproteobacteria bacterium]